MTRRSDIGEKWLIIALDLDIPSLTQNGIQIVEDEIFCEVQELYSSS